MYTLGYYFTGKTKTEFPLSINNFRRVKFWLHQEKYYVDIILYW